MFFAHFPLLFMLLLSHWTCSLTTAFASFLCPSLFLVAQAVESGHTAAREALRASHGIKVMLSLLQGGRSANHLQALHALRAATCRVLLGMSRDPVIRHILSKLQVGGLGLHVTHTDIRCFLRFSSCCCRSCTLLPLSSSI